jgi:hypothetical protein
VVTDGTVPALEVVKETIDPLTVPLLLVATRRK